MIGSLDQACRRIVHFLRRSRVTAHRNDVARDYSKTRLMEATGGSLSRDRHLEKVPGFIEFHLPKGPEAEDHIQIIEEPPATVPRPLASPDRTGASGRIPPRQNFRFLKLLLVGLPNAHRAPARGQFPTCGWQRPRRTAMPGKHSAGQQPSGSSVGAVLGPRIEVRLSASILLQKSKIEQP